MLVVAQLGILFAEQHHQLRVHLVAFAPDKSWVKVAELVVVPTDEDAKPESEQKDAPTKLRKDTQNEFV